MTSGISSADRYAVVNVNTRQVVPTDDRQDKKKRKGHKRSEIATRKLEKTLDESRSAETKPAKGDLQWSNFTDGEQ